MQVDFFNYFKKVFKSAINMDITTSVNHLLICLVCCYLNLECLGRAVRMIRLMKLLSLLRLLRLSRLMRYASQWTEVSIAIILIALNYILLLCYFLSF